MTTNTKPMQQSTPRKHVVASAAPPRPKYDLTEAQRRTLELLYNYRKLDAQTIKEQIAPGSSRQYWSKFLVELETLGLIKQERQPGAASIVNLLKAGANELGRDMRGSGYKDISLSTRKLYRMQLRLEALAKKLNLVLYRELPNSPGDKTMLPYDNPARQVVREHYRILERRSINNLVAVKEYIDPMRIRDLEADVLPIPLYFRDYYIHAPGQTGAILILTRPGANSKFWAAKYKDFKALAGRRHLPIIAVFNSAPPEKLKNLLLDEATKDDNAKAAFKLASLEKLEPALRKHLNLPAAPAAGEPASEAASKPIRKPAKP